MKTDQPGEKGLSATKRICLLLIIWCGLPLVSAWLTDLFATRSTNNLLFLFYLLFSWSIALLVFVLETARQRLLHQDTVWKCTIRLVALAVLALLTALLLSPMRKEATAISVIYLLLNVVIYTMFSGWAYYKLQNKKTESQHSV